MIADPEVTNSRRSVPVSFVPRQSPSSSDLSRLFLIPSPKLQTPGRLIEMYGSRPTLIFAVVFVCQEQARALSGFVSPGGSCVRQTVIRGSLGTLVL